jgi:hypothetical protein
LSVSVEALDAPVQLVDGSTEALAVLLGVFRPL